MPDESAHCGADHGAVGRNGKFYEGLIESLSLFAQSEFALNKAQDEKSTLRDHLNSLWRQTGEKPQQLAEAPELPPLGAHVWKYFCELNAERGSNGMAASKITAENVKDWMWFSGTKSLALWERRAIRALDNVRMRSQNV